MCIKAILKGIRSVCVLCSVLSSSQCEVLACALAILATIPPHSPPSLLLEQLCFLAEGREGYLCADDTPPLPSRPASISHDLWTTLHLVPFSQSYFSHHVAPSGHSDSDREFWTGIERGKGRSVSEFPWRRDWRGPECLDDLLMLALVHQPTAVELVGRATARLTGSVRPRPLSELVLTPEGDKRKPLLLVDDPDQLLCELNMLFLEEELKRISEVSEHVLGLIQMFYDVRIYDSLYCCPICMVCIYSLLTFSLALSSSLPPSLPLASRISS